ncbi:hypothetical protein CEXT_655291 [Caerostris extrusa]|uniref:Uncharacterized protein n=1 Tax=Caerostris extrusa TaxID=172846 RepID=A0AAV4MIX6_CAEEX|nr:hypothetical protein CEXT_655291 [Caerostris extrusa]
MQNRSLLFNLGHSNTIIHQRIHRFCYSKAFRFQDLLTTRYIEIRENCAASEIQRVETRYIEIKESGVPSDILLIISNGMCEIPSPLCIKESIDFAVPKLLDFKTILQQDTLKLRKTVQASEMQRVIISGMCEIPAPLYIKESVDFPIPKLLDLKTSLQQDTLKPRKISESSI